MQQVTLSHRWRNLPLLVLLGCLGGYLLFLGMLTIAERETVSRFEEQLRAIPPIENTVQKSFRSHFGAEWYTVRHIIALFPLGLLAAGAAWLVGLTGSRRRGLRAGGKLLALAAGFVVLQEIVQIWIPGRQALVSDVLAGWAGIALGFAAGTGVCWAMTVCVRGVRRLPGRIRGESGLQHGTDSSKPTGSHGLP